MFLMILFRLKKALYLKQLALKSLVLLARYFLVLNIFFIFHVLCLKYLKFKKFNFKIALKCM